MLSMVNSPSLSPLLPLPQLDTLHGRDVADMTGPRIKPNAAITQPGKSFKDALLYLGRVPSTKAAPRFRKPLVACFWWLTSDHFARDCHDPIWCHRCGRSGHMERSYKVPRQHATLWCYRPSTPPPQPSPSAFHPTVHAPSYLPTPPPPPLSFPTAPLHTSSSQGAPPPWLRRTQHPTLITSLRSTALAPQRGRPGPLTSMPPVLIAPHPLSAWLVELSLHLLLPRAMCLCCGGLSGCL